VCHLSPPTFSYSSPTLLLLYYNNALGSWQYAGCCCVYRAVLNRRDGRSICIQNGGLQSRSIQAATSFSDSPRRSKRESAATKVSRGPVHFPTVDNNAPTRYANLVVPADSAPTQHPIRQPCRARGFCSNPASRTLIKKSQYVDREGAASRGRNGRRSGLGMTKKGAAAALATCVRSSASPPYGLRPTAQDGSLPLTDSHTRVVAFCVPRRSRRHRLLRERTGGIRKRRTEAVAL
jgi:hypothetical protein